VQMRSMSFLVEPQNQGQQFVSGLASKPLRRFLIGLSLKTDGDSVSVVRPQTHWNGFLRFASKPVAMVSHRFGPQN
jgi:hypothetical protein